MEEYLFTIIGPDIEYEKIWTGDELAVIDYNWFYNEFGGPMAVGTTWTISRLK